MERCSNCGRVLDPGSWTCPVCGGEARVPPVSSSGPAGPTAPTAVEVPRVPPPLPSGNDPSRLAEARGLGWNWGGFLMPYLWLLGHGRLGAGLFLMLSTWIPFVGFIHLLLYPVAGLYLGFNGNEIAWRHQPYHSVEQLRDCEREWTLWGVILAILGALGLLLLVVYTRVILEEALKGMEGLGL